MTPDELDSYAEVMTRRGISSFTIGDVVILMAPRLVNAEPTVTEEKRPKRANMADAALSLA